MSVFVKEDLCIGCESCISSCVFNALAMVGDKAVINENCTACQACVETCPTEAIVSEESASESSQLGEYKNVWVICEQREGNVSPSAVELLSEGRKLADSLGQNLCGVILGENNDANLDYLMGYGADKIFSIEDTALGVYKTEEYTGAIADLAKGEKPNIILIAATSIGRDLGPRIAARLNTGLTADCTKLEIDKEKGMLLQTRPAFGGNLMATIITPDHRPQMSTVRPGVMKKVENKKTAEVVKLGLKPDEKFNQIKVLEVVKAIKDSVDITAAKVIVSGGRGMGSGENFKKLEELATALGGVVAASRGAVDNKWIDSTRQVGQTGKTVRPTLYIACGISGAIQHMAGMQASDHIIAINKSADAPICQIADYCLIGDANTLVPMLTEAIGNR